jgi:hypothetical protein
MAEFGGLPEFASLCLAVGAAQVALAILTPASMLLATRCRSFYVTPDDPLARSMGAAGSVSSAVESSAGAMPAVGWPRAPGSPVSLLSCKRPVRPGQAS